VVAVRQNLPDARVDGVEVLPDRQHVEGLLGADPDLLDAEEEERQHDLDADRASSKKPSPKWRPIGERYRRDHRKYRCVARD
jgi:hypothetical protein